MWIYSKTIDITMCTLIYSIGFDVSFTQSSLVMIWTVDTSFWLSSIWLKMKRKKMKLNGYQWFDVDLQKEWFHNNFWNFVSKKRQRKKQKKMLAMQPILSRVLSWILLFSFFLISKYIILLYDKQRRSLSFVSSSLFSEQWNKWESFTCSLCSSVCVIVWNDYVHWQFSILSKHILAQYVWVHGDDSSTIGVSQWRSWQKAYESFKVTSIWSNRSCWKIWIELFEISSFRLT